jgi:hypothetical protein
MADPLVGVIMGSTSDWETMRHACASLETLGVPFEQRVVSAHRTPDLLFEYASTARGRGLAVIIAGAGGAAHLPGMVASKTTLPVLGVPVQSKALNGMDSLLSIAQMPAGDPRRHARDRQGRGRERRPARGLDRRGGPPGVHGRAGGLPAGADRAGAREPGPGRVTPDGASANAPVCRECGYPLAGLDACPECGWTPGDPVSTGRVASGLLFYFACTIPIIEAVVLLGWGIQHLLVPPGLAARNSSRSGPRFWAWSPRPS